MNKKSEKIIEKSRKNVWWFRKKAIPLQPQFRNEALDNKSNLHP